MLATTDATTIGPKFSITIVPSTISVTNSAPAMRRVVGRRDAGGGAAGDQQTQARRMSKRSTRPSSDAQSAASCTIEPSRPIEPPEAIVHSDDTLRSRFWRTGMWPSPIAIASM